MTTATYTRPNSTTQSATAYKGNIDAMAKVFERIAGAFAPHEQDQGSPAPEMSVRVDAGYILSGITLTEVAAQTVSGFTTPAAGQERYDRVVIDVSTGVASRIAGTASTGSPSAGLPALTTGKVPCCYVRLRDTDTVITNDMIVDERTAGGGTAAATQAQMEAGSDATVAVTPAVAQYHPSAAKAWCKANATGSYSAAYNIASIDDNATGDIGFVIATDFSSADYAAQFFFTAAGATTNHAFMFGQSAGTFRAQIVDAAAAAIDAPPYYFIAHGDQ